MTKYRQRQLKGGKIYFVHDFIGFNPPWHSGAEKLTS
jgi:hypothetical protein